MSSESRVTFLLVIHVILNSTKLSTLGNKPMPISHTIKSRDSLVVAFAHKLTPKQLIVRTAARYLYSTILHVRPRQKLKCVTIGSTEQAFHLDKSVCTCT